MIMEKIRDRVKNKLNVIIIVYLFGFISLSCAFLLLLSDSN